MVQVASTSLAGGWEDVRRLPTPNPRPTTSQSMHRWMRLAKVLVHTHRAWNLLNTLAKRGDSEVFNIYDASEGNSEDEGHCPGEAASSSQSSRSRMSSLSCQHPAITRAGSNQFVAKMVCKDCKFVVAQTPCRGFTQAEIEAELLKQWVAAQTAAQKKGGDANVDYPARLPQRVARAVDVRTMTRPCDCGRKMMLRYNRTDGSALWGCEGFAARLCAKTLPFRVEEI